MFKATNGGAMTLAGDKRFVQEHAVIDFIELFFDWIYRCIISKIFEGTYLSFVIFMLHE